MYRSYPLANLLNFSEELAHCDCILNNYLVTSPVTSELRDSHVADSIDSIVV